MGCMVLDIPTSWGDESVALIAKGLRKAHDISSKYHNYMIRGGLKRFLHRETISFELGLLRYCSFRCLSRAQSGCLPTRRSRVADPLLTRTKQNEKAIIGIRTFTAESRLVLML